MNLWQLLNTNINDFLIFPFDVEYRDIVIGIAVMRRLKKVIRSWARGLGLRLPHIKVGGTIKKKYRPLSPKKGIICHEEGWGGFFSHFENKHPH